MIRTRFPLAVAVGLSVSAAAADDGWRAGAAVREPGWQPVRPADPQTLPPRPLPTLSVPVPVPPSALVALPIPVAPVLAVPPPVLPSFVRPVIQVEPRPVTDPKPTDRPMPPPAPSPRTLPPPRTVTDDPPPASTPVPMAVAEGVVWGAYVPAGTPAAKPPVRHHTFGSPSLRLSRDYHLLDAFTGSLAGDDEQIVLKESAAAVSRSFVQTEFLLWWANRPNIPVLASTGPVVVLPDPFTPGRSLIRSGFLGEPGTRVLLGPGPFGDSQRTGFRVRAGTWLDACQTCGIDASYFTLGRDSTSALFPADRFPALTRPFFAVNRNEEFGELVSLPDRFVGTLNVRQSSELWGADVNLRKNLLACACDRRLEAFAGYRHLSLTEDLAVTEFIIAGANALDPENNPPGTRIVVQDRFATTNRFHGGQLGLSGYRSFGTVFVSGRASVALGTTNQILDISGSQVRTRPGAAPETFQGGLLATGPNLGRFTRDRFSVVPEATLNVGLRVTSSVNVYAGYNFLGWTNVLRPGDQIDRVVDTTFVPNFPVGGAVRTTNRPLPTFRQSDLWVHGVQLGVEFRW